MDVDRHKGYNPKTESVCAHEHVWQMEASSHPPEYKLCTWHIHVLSF